MKKEFRQAYENLSGTVKGLYSFTELHAFLLKAMRNVKVRLINAESDTRPEDIVWEGNYSWILVGGRALDRGFTLKGLTVSYIPRGIGGGMADSIQQRGRFFGYKKSYISYCRVFLGSDSRKAFTEYVEHEESLRKEIQTSIESGQNAKEWRRAFLLSPRLIPCRRNVVEKFYRGKFCAQWVYPNHVPTNDLFIEHNNEMIKNFIKGREIIPHKRISASDSSLLVRKIASPPTLQEMREKLLLSYQYLHRLDIERIMGALFQLNAYIGSCSGASEEKCDVFFMNEQERNRVRDVDSQGKINELFQGESPGNDNYYEGDRQVRGTENNVTVQIHYLAMKRNKKIFCRNVPIIAIWIPEKLAKATEAWLVQEPSENE